MKVISDSWIDDMGAGKQLKDWKFKGVQRIFLFSDFSSINFNQTFINYEWSKP
jgi:hypothetical protein